MGGSDSFAFLDQRSFDRQFTARKTKTTQSETII